MGGEQHQRVECEHNTLTTTEAHYNMSYDLKIEGIPLLLSLRNLVGLEPVVWNVQCAGVIVWVIWPPLPAVHDPVWPQKGELVSRSGSIPLSITVLNGLPGTSCNMQLC